MPLAMRRRGIIAGLGGLLAAPFIVRVANLMPISPTDTYRTGLMGWEAFTEEVARQVRLALMRRDDVAGWAPLSHDASQHGMTVELANKDIIGQSVQAIRERHILPIAHNLASAVPSRHRVLEVPCPLPLGVNAAYGISKGGCGLRAVRQYDINRDTMLMRFDIRSV